MLFRSVLRRELISLSGTVFATLFTITLTMTLVRLLGRAAGGKEAAEIVLPLIAFQALGFLPVLLTLTVYIAVLAALTRAWKDAEMAVWFAAGQSLAAWVRPVLSFALPIALIVAVLSLGVSPWAQRQTERFRVKAEEQTDANKVSPGQFRESLGQDRVFFVEGADNESERVGNVFVASWDHDRLTLVVAATGKLATEADGDRYAVLEQGRRYDGIPGQLIWRELRFGSYAMRLEQAAPKSNRENTVRALTTPQLLRQPDNIKRGELAWRIGLPISCLLLPLLAIPLSAINVRAGRSINLLGALLLYVLYSNLLSLMQAYIAQGKAKFEIAVWPAHLAVLVLALWLLRRRLILHRSWWSRLMLRLGDWRRARAAARSGGAA